MKNVLFIIVILLGASFNVASQTEKVQEILKEMSEEVSYLTETGASVTVINNVIATYKEAIQLVSAQDSISQQPEPQVVQQPEPQIVYVNSPAREETTQRPRNIAQENKSAIGSTSAFRKRRQENTLDVSRRRWSHDVNQQRDIFDLEVTESVIERRFGASSNQSNTKVLGYVKFSVSDFAALYERREAIAFYKVVEVDRNNQMIPGSMIYEGSIKEGETKWFELESGATYLITMTYENRTGKRKVTPMSDNPRGKLEDKNYFWSSHLNIYSIRDWRNSRADVWGQ